MGRVGGLLLGIVAALAGFIDVGELIYALQAGARYGYYLLWSLVLGTVAIIVFGEMAGRVAAVAKRASFDLIRERLPRWLGLAVLAAATLVAVIITAAELGGVAVVLQAVTGWPYRLAFLAAGAFVLACLLAMSFKAIEYVFGLLSLALFIYAVAVVVARPDWTQAALGVLPRVPQLASGSEALVYAYFAVGIMATVMMPCQVYFYSAGAIEEGWEAKDLGLNLATVIVGFVFGGLVAAALIVLGAVLFLPASIFPQSVSTSYVVALEPLGKAGYWVAFVGLFFSIAASALTGALAGGYNLAQYFGWRWGKSEPHREVPRFTAAWLAIFAAAFALGLAGFQPLELVQYGVMASLLVLPFAFYPLLVAAGDRALMGAHANGALLQRVGWVLWAISAVLGVSALPLLLVTKGGLA